MIDADTGKNIKFSIIGVPSKKDFRKKLKKLEKQGAIKEISLREFNKILEEELSVNE